MISWFVALMGVFDLKHFLIGYVFSHGGMQFIAKMSIFRWKLLEIVNLDEQSMAKSSLLEFSEYLAIFSVIATTQPLTVAIFFSFMCDVQYLWPLGIIHRERHDIMKWHWIFLMFLLQYSSNHIESFSNFSYEDLSPYTGFPFVVLYRPSHQFWT